MRTIGASFSGGGFRAAGFTMGCLSYLDKVELDGRTLLSNIVYSSSTSGGSIAMALQAVRSYQGVPFPEILHEARDRMKGDALLAEAMRILRDPCVWEDYPTKNRDLINAFAIAYDRKLYGGATLGFLADKSKRPSIERYCFNATELNNGISFRFDLSGDAATVQDVGNYWQHFGPGAENALNRIRLADVAAASSCFPGGFEPMVFPDDYEYKDPIGLKTALFNENKVPLPADRLPFGLVDGGAVDNEGLYSLEIETQRLTERGRTPFDLLLICDVSSFYMDAYAPPSSRGAWSGGLRLGQLPWIAALGVLGIFAAMVVALVMKAWLVVGALILPCSLVLLLGGKLLGLFKGGSSSSWGTMLNKFGLPLLKSLSIGTLIYFLQARMRSLGLLFGNVFMNQIRRQRYGDIYDAEGNKLKIISCLIYELASKNTANLARSMARKRAVAEKAGHVALWDAAVAPLTASQDLLKVADSAASMGTTLWFDTADEHKLDDIIACGQFTMCFNLLVYLAEVEGEHGSLDLAQKDLRATLLKDWKQFLSDPTTMHLHPNN